MSKQDLEVRRRTAVNLVERGGLTYRQAAEAVGAVPSSVSDWMKAYREGGASGLAPKSEKGKNSESQLGPDDRARLAEMLREGATAHGFETELWTLSRVQKVIEREFDVSFSVGHVHRVLGEMGFSSQKPERRSREQDPEAVKAFREEAWPSLGKKHGTRVERSS